jgi:hypothetical protein
LPATRRGFSTSSSATSLASYSQHEIAATTNLSGDVSTFSMKRCAMGTAMVQNLVQLSFVENVGPFVGDAATFNETWPTALRREAERQRDWKRGDPGPASVCG